MKVLYFTRDYSPHDERFLTALAQTQHEVYFLRLSPSSEIHLPPRIGEVKWTSLLAGEIISEERRAEDLNQLLSRLQPDVLHAGPLHGPAYIAGLSGFSPLVSMSWGSDILHDGEVDALARAKNNLSLQRSTVFLGDCQAVVEKAISAFAFPPERVFRFPWGVDLAHFSPSTTSTLRASLGWQHQFVFLSNRSFEEIYGVDVVMRAFIQAQSRAPNIRLLLYGRGSLQQEIMRMAENAGVMHKLHFAAFAGREELPASYHAADVFLSASHCDGSSVSLMEALACGKPALVSNIPGNLEWVHHGENGWLFQDGDVSGLADAMVAVSREPNLEELGRKSRALAEEKANWSCNFAVLLQAYQKAVEWRTPALKIKERVK